jgi:hypothetical protein
MIAMNHVVHNIVPPHFDHDMYPLFRFTGIPLSPLAIAEWFDARPAGLAAIARPWLAHVRDLGADVRIFLHDGCPVACVEDAPFALVNVFSAHAAVGFFHGAALPDAGGMLAGTGKYMRHVKLRPGHRVDAAALAALIHSAYEDVRRRLAHERDHLPAARNVSRDW